MFALGFIIGLVLGFAQALVLVILIQINKETE